MIHFVSTLLLTTNAAIGRVVPLAWHIYEAFPDLELSTQCQILMNRLCEDLFWSGHLLSKTCAADDRIF